MDINRRKFLSLFGGGIISTVAVPTKTYAFFRNILRPRATWQNHAIPLKEGTFWIPISLIHLERIIGMKIETYHVEGESFYVTEIG